VPYIKEIHYFDGQSHGLPNDFIRRLFHKRVGYWRRSLKRQIFKKVTLKNMQRAKWLLNYALRTRNDKWYASLFNPDTGQVAGEHSPGYYCLPCMHVERIHKMMPECKIIYLVRNPVEQIWSMVKFMNFKIQKKEFEDISLDQIKEMCVDNYRIHNTDYLFHLANWEKFFPKENIFLGFYDEIRDCPDQLLLRIFDFLEVEKSEDHIYPIVRKIINKGPEYEIPDNIRVLLGLKTYDILKGLHERFGGYATKWLEEETEFLEKHGALPECDLNIQKTSNNICAVS
tara:strand:+ start:4368 stop:5222 length:855 start_codon:yes stop_codon:yes gene_type:complete